MPQGRRIHRSVLSSFHGSCSTHILAPREHLAIAASATPRLERNCSDGAPAQEVHLRRQAARFFHAGNTNFKAEQSRFRGKKGEPKEKPERTAGVRAVQRLFDELGARYKDRNGGYTRIIKLGRRQGDNAEMAVIELVDNPRELAAKA